MKETYREGTFDTEDGPHRFGVIYDAILAAFGRAAAGGIDRLRACNRLMDKLDAISLEVGVFRRDGSEGTTRRLMPEAQRLLLTTSEYDRLVAMVSDPKIEWNPQAGRRAEETIEWVKSWVQVEQERVKA